MKSKEYIRKFKKFIKNKLQGTRLLPSIVMAHAMYEAASDEGSIGESVHATRHNNDVRLLADKSWRGRKVLLPIRQSIKNSERPRKTWFRSYMSSERAIEDRIKMLTRRLPTWPTSSFYNETMECQALILQHTGVSSDPHYADRMVKIIKKHKLYRLDRQWWIEKLVINAVIYSVVGYAIVHWDEWVPWRQ